MVNISVGMSIKRSSDFMNKIIPRFYSITASFGLDLDILLSAWEPTEADTKTALLRDLILLLLFNTLLIRLLNGLSLLQNHDFLSDSVRLITGILVDNINREEVFNEARDLKSLDVETWSKAIIQLKT
eukprot:CAMPEP_0114584886 /NCGR_PEP_ID=MMETSP0125-20121206/8520_1 /TAXON_ID=485358 ORGANISM="Aristerostoma sp., Strain ATCC 50986" /NCGR_SAMPLE_ID=MMETSP0125 /ASSEMBLY_ACC=CAM_ASM_000245 /LENGTH=127 /DNA_ID=CAMNT_0001779593 /DNA_START=624 /DNA_END=1007 /DNA_ORIENTATION=-